MSADDIDLIRIGTPLHDIGKIGIDDAILRKPGKLTAGEWEIMKQHTTIGGDLLAGSRLPLVQMAEVIARTHHERWDGSGYPAGLVGEQIPLAGRICAVGDVCDALISDRPYKAAWSIEDTLAEIGRQRGRHFDPDLVDLLLAMAPDLVREHHADPAASRAAA